MPGRKSKKSLKPAVSTAIIFFIVITTALIVYFVQYPKEILKSFAVTNTTPVLTRSGTLFLINGKPISRFGLRTANALESDEVTQNLINKLNLMKSYGI